MGFGGGGSNVTRAHTHDSAVIADGGSLAANATQFGLSNQSMLVSDGTNIQELAIGSEGDNITVGAGGVLSWEAHVAGDVLAGNLVMANSTTIGDYTQPASATSSSETGGGSFTNDFSSAVGWTLTTGGTSDPTISAGTGNLSYTSGDTTTNYWGSIAMGFTLDDTADWTADFDVKANSYGGTGGSIRIGLTDTAGAVVSNSSSPYDNGNTLTVMTAHNGGGYYGRMDYGTGSGVSEGAYNDTAMAGSTWYYMRMARVGGNIVVKNYPTALDRTNDTNQSGSTGTNAIATMSGLNHVIFGAWRNSLMTFNGNVDNPTITQAGPQPASNVIDDNVATYWESDTQVNPNIYVDMSSASSTSNIAVYPNALTTETEIKIQSSTDAISWTDERTILTTNWTNGAWNYIRFNLISSQYWRIYGNSGNSRVLAINEIKVLDSVSDADVRNLHGHIPISSSDTSLNNAGV